LASLSENGSFQRVTVCKDHPTYCALCKRTTLQELVLFTSIEHELWLTRCPECQNISIDEVVCKKGGG